MPTITSGFNESVTIQVGERIRFNPNGRCTVTINGVAETLDSAKTYGGYAVATVAQVSNVTNSVTWDRVASLITDNTANIDSAVAASRQLTSADNNKTLECTASGVDLTIPLNLDGFADGCAVVINGTTRVIGASGVTVNGTTGGTVTITAAVGAIVPLSTPNAYRVVGV